MAIDVQNADYDGLDLLDMVINGLSTTDVPDDAKQLLPVFMQARQIVLKKRQCCAEIVNASIAINTTTRFHRSSGISGIHTHLSDFEIIAKLSSGAFARVYLSKKKKTGDLYAIKVIKKSYMGQKNNIRSVSNERDIMRRLHSPYIVNFCMYFFCQRMQKYNID